MLNNWIEKKIIYKPEKKCSWMQSHCMLPTPLKIKENIYGKKGFGIAKLQK